MHSSLYCTSTFCQFINRGSLQLICSHDTIICTLWDDWAAQFVDFWNQRRERNQSGIVVVIVKHGRIKEAQGKYPTGLANAWNGTKLFTNQDMEEIQNFKKEYVQKLTMLRSYVLRYKMLIDCLFK